jgi:hypothetical protein
MTELELLLEKFSSGQLSLAELESALKDARAGSDVADGEIGRVVAEFVAAGKISAELADTLAGSAPAEAPDHGGTLFRGSNASRPHPGIGVARSTPGDSSGHDSSGWRRWATAEHAEGAVKVGTVLRGRFVIEEVIGEGGMGLVFRARDLRREEAHDRNPFVAIKMLGEDFKGHPDSLIALQREARRMQQLSHPNIASVHDFDRDGSHVFLVMELLEGESLDRMLERNAGAGLPLEQVQSIVSGVAGALRHAHTKSFVHSDLKPGNVFVTRDGEVKVIDFGIARIAKDTTKVGDGVQTLFDAGSLGAWTNAYASPEQMMGSAEPDPRDDVYALGLVAYEMLTGKHPFQRKSAVEARFNELKLEPVAALSDEQNAVLASTLDFDRARRLANPLDLAGALKPPDEEKIYASNRIGAPRKAPSAAAEEPHRHRWRIAALSLVGVAWLAFMLMYWFGRQPAETADDSEAIALEAAGGAKGIANSEPEAATDAVEVDAQAAAGPGATPSVGRQAREATEPADPVPESAPAGEAPAAAVAAAPAQPAPEQTAAAAPANEPAAKSGSGGSSRPALYRWVDATGAVQFGENPPPEYADSAVKVMDL